MFSVAFRKWPSWACMARPHNVAPSLRPMTSQTAVVDQMIDHVYKKCEGKPDQAVDILRSGMAMHPTPCVDLVRLQLLLAAVEADRANWAGVVSASDQALTTVASLDPSAPHAALAVLQAHSLAVRAALLQGRDSEAIHHAGRAVRLTSQQGRASIRAAGLGLQLLAHHASGDVASAGQSAGQLAELLDTPAGQQTSTSGSTSGERGGGGDTRGGGFSGGAGGGADHALNASALNALAGWRLAQGDAASAGQLYQSATWSIAGSRQAVSDAPLPLDADALRDEAEACALLGQAQLKIDGAQWEAAEALLDGALSAAERVSGSHHPRVAPALLQLAHCYARSARHMLAEGLYRQCAKLLHVDPTIAPVSSSAPSVCHPSLLAALGWRFCQLLTVLPRRESEAAAWKELASAQWQNSGDALASRAPESVLGGLERLRGHGDDGCGLVLEQSALRVLPRQQSAKAQS